MEQQHFTSVMDIWTHRRAKSYAELYLLTLQIDPAFDALLAKLLYSVSPMIHTTEYKLSKAFHTFTSKRYDL